MRWTSDEVMWLVQAWQETKKEVKDSGVKKNLEEFHQLVHENFEKLAGGSSPRSVSAVRRQMNILKDSYDFIVSFQGREQENGWFALSTNDQKTLMQTDGGNQVRPIDGQVFSALDKFLAEEESESEDSDGEKFETAVKKRAASKKKSARKSTSVLEEESGELLTPTKEEKIKDKRRRVSKTSVGVADILDRQSQGLAGFLEKRADERSHEIEQSRKEREADQKFWSEETAKDRALLRDLFTQD
ncbi:hypothetical protein P3T76_009398 [Phytophthora citrophthora]|uniref:Uncharacterized protein n=1 Tax=Phytophthora citrophthora TaxID=4793 RepID=A0AAD9GGZ6_9STRA|nr:hypothetical protein P3T76_009398 [Phytophthora citrophthora]